MIAARSVVPHVHPNFSESGMGLNHFDAGFAEGAAKHGSQDDMEGWVIGHVGTLHLFPTNHPAPSVATKGYGGSARVPVIRSPAQKFLPNISTLIRALVRVDIYLARSNYPAKMGGQGITCR